ncbi:MAG: GAF domain-containing protein [Candidatus Wallbacteria bacterium]|nr:GAF domain-containing protein [Candidatus Wallbacteria bacterium]
MIDRRKIFRTLERDIHGIVAGKGSVSDKLQRICDLLRKEVEHYDWVGFYLADPVKERNLVLGPFSGEPTEHTSIAFGQGICGQAADREETFVVQDVTAETNYLSCSSAVKSEIVVPVSKSGRIVGELDIDSHVFSPFQPDDREFLEKVAGLVAGIL